MLCSEITDFAPPSGGGALSTPGCSGGHARRRFGGVVQGLALLLGVI